jgi:putative component of membrane protein insertase Oxa1/YidC/SpoIIIJ protein YidD
MKPAALPLVGLVRAYQWLVGPLLPPSCRFYPSCSA